MTSPPADCPHCTTPDACSRLCDSCPCPACTPCLECVRWIGTITRHQIRMAAIEHGKPEQTTRAALLAAYHDAHMED